MYNAGDFLEDATVYIPFNTFDSNDPSASVTITDLVAGDVEVWKNGVVQTTPGAGVTITLNIGTNNGTHLIAVDTSNTTDAGWFVTGADYQVRINGTTVDGATINAWVGTFSTENRFKEVTVTSMANNVIDNAAFAADVGSTAYASNIIALAVRKVLDELNLDHLMKVVTAAADMTTEIVDNTALSRILSNGDTSAFVPSTDGLQPIRDVAPHGSTMVGTDSAALASVLGAAVGASISVDIAAIKTVSDAVKVVTDNLASSATTIVSGTVSHDNTAATTTVFFSDDITEATADHYNGRIVIFTSGALQNQASDITDYALDTGEGKFTVTALTEAPADNVTFVIV